MTKILLYFSLLIFLSSCSFRYQVFDTSSSEVLTYKDDVYISESDDIEIYYDFWVHGGVMLFKIHNTSGRPLYIDLDKSYFIHNKDSVRYQVNNIDNRDESFDRYEWHSDAIIKLPANEGLQIEGHPVNHRWIPLRNGGKRTRSFDKDNSPFKFGNRIAYAYDPNMEIIEKVQNEFWVSEIRKMKRAEFEDYNTVEPNTSDKFYVRRDTNDDDPVFWLDLAAAIIDTLVYFF